MTALIKEIYVSATYLIDDTILELISSRHVTFRYTFYAFLI